MKQYICLNYGECNWADENPPREFPLPDGEDQFCPRCASTNIKEKPKPPGPPWLKIAGVIGLVLLVAGLAWLFWKKTFDPLVIKGELNCETGILSIASTGGDSTAITFGVEGLNSKNNEFPIPVSQRKGKEFKLSATQNGVTVETTYSTSCPRFEDTIDGTKSNGPGSNTTTGKRPPITYRKVEGSEFCVSDCVLSYSEIDNLGRVRTRRVENYAECCPATK